MREHQRDEQKLAGHAREHSLNFDLYKILGSWPDVLPTTRHFTHTGSLGGTCRNSSHCRRMSCSLWRTGRRLKIIPAGLPRDHVPILLTLRNTLQPPRRKAVESTPQLGDKWELQAIADWLQRRGHRLEITHESSHIRWTTHLRKRHRNSKHCERIPHLAHPGHSASTASSHTAQRRGTMHQRDSLSNANWSLDK